MWKRLVSHFDTSRFLRSRRSAVQTNVSSSRKSKTPILRTPLSSYQRTFPDVVPDDDLRKRVPRQGERFVFRDRLFLRPKSIGGLDISLFSAGSSNEVDLPCYRGQFSFGISLVAVHDPMSTAHSRTISSLKMMFSMMWVISCWRKPMRAFRRPMSSQ